MEKRHQVFVSSTYKDLVEARRVVMQQLLEIDCIPTGMEVFPASDESAWELIERVIKGCDYYVLVIGGRYGCVGEESGLSFTEREYSLAEKSEVPILAFVHSDPDGLLVRQTDDDPVKKASLAKFRDRVMRGKHVKEWNSVDQLAAKVVTALTHAKNTRPRSGWIRADQAVDPSLLQRVEQLRAENDRLKAHVTELTELAPAGAELWEFGDAEVVLHYTYYERRTEARRKDELRATWNNLFRLLGPHAMTPIANEVWRGYLLSWIELGRRTDPQAVLQSRSDYTLPNETFNQVTIQFLAIGLIRLVPTDAISKGSVWQLTPYGHRTLLELLAKPRKQAGRTA